MNRASTPPGTSSGRPSLLRSPWVRWTVYLLGLALLAGAILIAARQGGDARAALDDLRTSGGLRHRWWMLAGLALLPLGNFACSTALLLLLTRPHAAPGQSPRATEMAALVGGAWLLNYAPLAPGLIGRAAYHARVHGIPVTTTARIIVQTIGVSVVSLALAAGATLLLAWLQAGAEQIVLVLLVVAMLLATIPLSMLRSAGSRLGARWLFGSVVAVRLLDIGVWAARYGMAFGILGITLSPAECLGFAVVSQVAVLVPLLGNGLGLREWAIGVGAGAVPATADATRGLVSPIGLLADLINRGAEVLVAIPVGVVSLAWLAHRSRQGGTMPDGGSSSEQTQENG